MKRRTLAVGLGVLLVASSVAFGAADYTVSIPGSIETPEKTVTVEGDSFTISSIARVEKGATLSVETTGPSGESYYVYVHGVEDGSRRVQDTDFVPADDDGTVSFNTTEFTPGSYSVSIYNADTGQYYSPHPVVVPAFETGVVAPEFATVNNDFEVAVSTERIESGPSISGVELVFTQAENTKRVDASETDGEYTASVSLTNTGDWSVYAVVKGTEDAPRGEQELIGISDPVQVVVESESTTPTTTTSTSSNNGDSGGDGDTGGDGEGEATETSTKDPTTTPNSGTTGEAPTTVTTTAGPEPTTTSTSEGPPTSTTEQPPQDNGSEPSTVSPSTSDVIEPNTDTNNDSSNGVVGETALVLLALLGTVGLLVRDP